MAVRCTGYVVRMYNNRTITNNIENRKQRGMLKTVHLHVHVHYIRTVHVHSCIHIPV